MSQKVVAIALEIVTDEIGVVTVGDEANALGQERIIDLDLFQANRTGLAGDFGNAGDFIDQFTLRHPPHREGEFEAKRRPMYDRCEREADQGCSGGAAKNQDGGMFGHEHVQVAAHQDNETDHADAGGQTETCR